VINLIKNIYQTPTSHGVDKRRIPLADMVNLIYAYFRPASMPSRIHPSTKALPVVGTPIVELLRGSASVGQSTLTRFYSLHTFVLPLLTSVFMLMHFLMIRKQGILGPL
jgi:hypothetical protein